MTRNTFASAVVNKVPARTDNGMSALQSSGDPLTELFYRIGAFRGQDVIPAFVSAYVKNPEVAIRIALWARDIRSGAGERKLFRDILNYLVKNDPEVAQRVMKRIPDLGRWDDLLVIEDDKLKFYAYRMIGDAIAAKNGLVCKWLPRKGHKAIELRNYFNMSPKQYRKTLVKLTKVVENDMCSKNWDSINFNQVPSVASSRYKKAFARHTSTYAEWVQKLVKGDKSVKVNASAIYPYDVIKGLNTYHINFSESNLNHIVAQWNALPNYIGDANILPLVDVSGSMTAPVSTGSKTSCLDVAVSLGLYCAEKNTGVFKDVFLTFSGNPQLLNLQGDILQKINQMIKSSCSMNTDLHKAIETILDTAKLNQVPAGEMPDILMVISDMQFDTCARYDDSAIEMIARKYRNAGYEMPKIVFWNLHASDNTPVSFRDHGTALISGFSPAIMKSVFSNQLEQFTPENVMLKTVMDSRYDF